MISWNAVTEATSYNIYWSTVPGVTKTTGAIIADVTSPYTHTGLTNHMTYYYVVAAVSGYVEGPESAQVSVPPTDRNVPGAPYNVSAASGDGSIVLDFTGINTDSYNIYWSYSPSITPLNGTKISVSSSPYTFTGASNGTAYYFVITALNSSGESAASSVVGATPAAATSGIPSGVTVAPRGNAITLTWTPVVGATKYYIYRSNTPGVVPDSLTYQGTSYTTSYTQDSLTNGVTYFYVVTALVSGTNSPASAEVMAVPAAQILAAPSLVTATPGYRAITLTWTPAVGATKYHIYRSNTPGVVPDSLTYQGTSYTTSYTKTSLTNGVTYYYVVVSGSESGGNSLPSMEVSATPQ